MAKKEALHSDKAPKVIGPYSQAIKSGSMVFLSGQIPLDPISMELVSHDIAEQTRQVLDNLTAVANAAGGTLDDCVKLTIYLTDLNHFSVVNEVMETYFSSPFPARATVEVSALPRAAQVEIEAILQAG
ncbi:reactive intermediate/imine deaminase [Pseudohongiella nitratireducens]|uniref:Reactive intermediate/imine deaminase n=1 Tax=Pseudohongiella nitratireducens TaxID=1768907 RepID=A0A917LUQ2_9GAMM|nr:RidA family protein [Pseudohongiella nitratireducens]GGG58567.1 reactive intermediate/imine deaminase [Pseudohongiella nitratireducens]